MKLNELHNLLESPDVLQNLSYQEVSKKALKYSKAADVDSASYNQMPKMSFAYIADSFKFDTHTGDGKETSNTTKAGDVMMSGPSGEKYSIASTKFDKSYTVAGNTAIPEQSPRQVALYDGNKEFEFDAPWGEKMVCKPGDYVVKEAEGKFYRIAKKEFEATYNKLK